MKHKSTQKTVHPFNRPVNYSSWMKYIKSQTTKNKANVKTLRSDTASV